MYNVFVKIIMMIMMMIYFYLHLKYTWHIADDTMTLVPFSNVVQACLLKSHVWYQYQNISVLNLDKWHTSCCVSKVSGCQSYKKSRMLVNLVWRLFTKTTFINFNLYSVHTLKKRKHLLAFKVSHLYKCILSTKKKCAHSGTFISC
jgi:hypothetical protein